MSSDVENGDPAAFFHRTSKQDEPCAGCGKIIPSGGLLQPRERGIFCLKCAGVGDLVFLAAGDVALTRRARKHTRRWAPVLRWSRSRKRYERQGILVEAAALAKATAECDQDAEARAAKRKIDGDRRERQDLAYRAEFANAIRRFFPGCPPTVPEIIAEHACQKHSGRVGRCAAAKELSERAITLAVVAHIRHLETGYDSLLLSGVERRQARERIRRGLQATLSAWRQPPG